MQFKKQQQDINKKNAHEFSQADFLNKIFKEKEVEDKVKRKVRIEAARALREANGSQKSLD